MGWIVLEAAAALLLLLFVVWWTMFSGRRRGELDDADSPPFPEAAPDSAVPPVGPQPGPPAQEASRGGSRKLKG